MCTIAVFRPKFSLYTGLAEPPRSAPSAQKRAKNPSKELWSVVSRGPSGERRPGSRPYCCNGRQSVPDPLPSESERPGSVDTRPLNGAAHAGGAGELPAIGNLGSPIPGQGAHHGLGGLRIGRDASTQGTFLDSSTEVAESLLRDCPENRDRSHSRLPQAAQKVRTRADRRSAPPKRGPETTFGYLSDGLFHEAG